VTRHFDGKLLVETYTPFNVVAKRNKKTVMIDAICNFAKCKNCAGDSAESICGMILSLRDAGFWSRQFYLLSVERLWKQRSQ